MVLSLKEAWNGKFMPSETTLSSWEIYLLNMNLKF